MKFQIGRQTLDLQSKEDVRKLARRKRCPRCDFDKTVGHALCSSCRRKLPSNMRVALETIEESEPGFVYRSLRSAANYFNVHFQSIRNFGGGKKK
jgi:predicted amidophosphoribosyltransferase